MNDLSKYVELYRMTTEHDTEVLWSKVAIIREAIADGADVETLLAECGKESGDSPEKVKRFYAVAMIFDNKAIAQNYNYWLYEACVTDPRIDVEDISTYHYAYEWFDLIEKREKKRGKTTIHITHTGNTLRKLIRAATQTGSGKPKPETVYKGAVMLHALDVKPYELNGGDFETEWKEALELIIPSELYHNLANDEEDIRSYTYHLTITRQPQPASADAVNEGSEAA